MKLLYLAGPYRAHGSHTVDDNIEAARNAAKCVAIVGRHYPVTPHLNTAHFDGKNSDQYFLDGTIELLRRCDAVLMLSGWQYSAGSMAERAEAFMREMRVFESLSEYCDEMRRTPVDVEGDS